MCGIVGIFDTKGSGEIDRELLSRMNESQFHRGPDEGGLHSEPGLGFGHRRLSIIDLSSGQQPMHSQDGNVVLTYNGEVYNFPALREDLQALGFSFRTHCDTEVILYAWQAWGEACVERLRGMFAFAIWDRPRETLFLARDRLGVKPLFYALLPNGQFIFGSELKALREHPLLPTAIDPSAIEDYFGFGYIPDPKTIYQGVYKLEPGYCLAIRRGQSGWQPRQYWDVRFQPQTGRQAEEAGEELIERLREAVKIRMVADVPLGAFLSGGVDSSAVVALMAGLSPDPVNTCSISFGDPKFNESQFAAQVAERYHTAHRVEQVDPDDFSLIDRLSALYDEPYADSSALPTYRVCELARKQVTVVLSGDGGDENLAGYRRYRWHTYEERMRSLMPDALRVPLFSTLGRIYPKLDWAPKVLRAKTTLESIGRDALAGYFHSVSVLSNDMRQRLFSDQLKRELQGYQAVEVFRRYGKQAPEHPLSRVQYLDIKTYLAGDILTKVDRASMAHALEVRVPLLDHKLVEWMATLPPDLKLKGHEGKYVFKQALEPYLPNDILYRPKMGFAIPLSAWFRGPLKQRVQESLLRGQLQQTGWFNQGYLEHLVSQHQSGLRDYSASIWALLMFEAFLRTQVS
ncbi:MAG: amidotransferase 1, exosortase A system-associated [Methylomonas sp.]|nr:amidotransferase 1, exosortase A system-associated [Methylomonas sp.]PPD19762.1 MAG: asparagine synthetase B [Methylomonas sp.]PPD25585.1 MAG: asparagine synthetase B [Methylomonas sp.]PPD36485.1 MAG: asparagine synthetase B [Methylomonas sp.]PPD40962.1 MAG: asparagine synthetase B [Methylomonas sp.]